MCGQREDAEEVAQETLLKVFESFDQLREPRTSSPVSLFDCPKRLPS